MYAFFFHMKRTATRNIGQLNLIFNTERVRNTKILQIKCLITVNFTVDYGSIT